MTTRNGPISLAVVLLACGGAPREHGASVAEGGRSNAVGGAGGSENEQGGRSAGGSLISLGGRNAGGGAMASAGSAGAPAGGESSGATGGRGLGGSESAGIGGRAIGGSDGGGGQGTTGGAPLGGSSAFAGSAGSDSGAPKKFCGNIDTRNAADPAGLEFSKHWDQITPENAGKWGSVQANVTGEFKWAVLDATYEYAQTNGIIFKESSFVWGAGTPGGGAAAVHVENWIRSFCQRYPNTKLIDVVQEPPPHTTPNYAQSLGAGETGMFPYIVKAFKLARKYCPQAVLILNDYYNIEYSDEQDYFIQIVNSSIAAGAPIDAVGAEAHSLKGVSAAVLKANIDNLASKTGLPIYITEYDIGDQADAVQLANFQAHFPVFWQNSAVRGVTLWGWIVGTTWIANSGLVQGTTPRPAMNWLMTELGRPLLAP